MRRFAVYTTVLLGGLTMLSAAADDGFKPRLLQVRLDGTSVPAGGTLGVTYWWQNVGDAPAPAEERVFVHIRRPGEAEEAPDGVRLGGDHEPSIPTQRWRPGRVVNYTAAVPVPPQTPPGDSVLLVGMFDPQGGPRRSLELPLPEGEDNRRYLVGRFRVVAAGERTEATPVTQTFFPVPSPEAEPAPPRPAKTVTVGRGPLTLVLDAEAPRVVAWRMAGAELSGDPELWEPEVRVLFVADNRVRLADARPYAITWAARPSGDEVVYNATVREGEKTCVAFALSFAVDASRAEVALASVVEHDGYQLVSVRAGRLVGAKDVARLALPLNAGRLIDPTKCGPAERAFGMDWFTQMLAGVVYDRRMLCAADIPGVEDRFVASVDEGWAAVGASFEHRAVAQPPVPSLLLGDRSVIRLRFLVPENGAPDWTDGARLLRAEVPARPPAVYDGTVIYKIFCDSPGAKDFTTFDQALDLVRRFGNLTDGAPQIAYLVGWQHQGHDTGYPDVFTINAHLGGKAGLIAAMKAAERYNALLSFHDNYDDGYEHSPAWDPALIARDPAGNLWKGGVWAGGQSYLMSFSERGAEAAKERVRRTLAPLPIKRSYHIDVLSAVPHRLDFNPQSPASGATSLAGKYAIVRAFNQHGVDVTSEGFCAPVVGILGHAWHLMRRGDALFAGEARIPFVPFVYHGHATYGGAQPTDDELGEALLYGATFSADFTKSTPQAALTDRYYTREGWEYTEVEVRRTSPVGVWCAPNTLLCTQRRRTCAIASVYS